MAKLGEVCKLVNGYAFKPSDWTEEGMPIIRIQNLNDETAPFNYFKGNIDKKYIVENGDLLFSWSGTPGTSFGAFFWNRGRGVLNQHIFNVYPQTGLLKDYFRYALNGNLQKIISKAHGGVGLQHITKKELETIEIPIPLLDEQRRIAAVLDKVSDLIAKRREQLDKLDELVKVRFVEMFGEPSTNPYGWLETTIGKECYYIKDGPHKSLQEADNGQGYPFISVRNIVNGFIDFSTTKYISEKDYLDSIKKCYPQKGDILYSKGGTTGIAKLIDIDVKFANWVHLAVLKFDSSLNGVFFENMLNSDYCYKQSQRLTKGIANKDLVLSAMAQIKLYKPPLGLQEQFANFVGQTNKSKLTIQQSLDKLEVLKKALMQQYFG